MPSKKNFNIVSCAAPPRLGIFGEGARRAHVAWRNGFALIQVFCTTKTELGIKNNELWALP